MKAEAAKGTNKRRAHEKSRQGCRNCKLRRVKCDEIRPACKKCTNFGVSCNFNANVPDLQMLGVGTLTIKSGVDSPLVFTNQITPRKLAVPAFLYPAIHSNLNLDREHLERFARFQTRTVLSVGTLKSAMIFKSVSAQLSFSEPYLMHMAQAITAIHDRYLASSPWSSNSKLTTTETFHLSRGAALFNKKLSEPLQNSERDSLWATAALLGIISFSTIEAATPEEAWPLKPSEPFDFEWIGMSEHKAAIFKLTDPLRPDSAFHGMTKEYAEFERLLSSYKPGIEDIPSELVDLYELDEFSTAENSPYYSAVQMMAQLLQQECTRGTIIPYLQFVSHIRPEFKSLLRIKDPRALLLMAFWYAKVGRAVWWLERRTMMQGQATCLYLERYHRDDAVIQKLLEIPKMRFAELARMIPI